MAYASLNTQASDAITTQMGDVLVTTDHVGYGGGLVRGQGSVYQNVNIVITSKGDTTFFVQYYDNGVRTKPPMGGGLVGGRAKDMVVWTPGDYYITTQNGDRLITQAGDEITTQLLYPMGGAHVMGFGVAGVVWRLSIPVRGGGVVKEVDETITPYWANWIITSRIGSMNFTHDDTGEVVKMVMPWYNWVYAMRKLGNSGVVVYGENGVVLLTPHGTAWGTRNVCQVGIKGKLAVCTSQDDHEHYFIDEQGFWWHIVEGQPAGRVDLTNYFNAMTDDTVLSWDYKNDIIYICDGTRGYIWTKGGLGQGPTTISGLGVRWGEDLFVVGPSVVTPAPFQICTDIIDFGSRTEKTINGINLGVTNTNDIYTTLDYRWESRDPFITSPWVKVDNQGQAFFMTTGIEFRIRAKLLTYEAIQLDYTNVRVMYEDAKPIGMAA